MEDLNALLSASIQHYEDILALFVTINNDRGNYNPTTLHARSTELLHLQQEVALADDALTVAMKEINLDPAAHSANYPLIKKRQEVMRQILVHNRSLLATIQNIQSLLAHEIKELRGGRAALSGYRQATSSQGSILNDSR
jgi:hypothetical protein